MREILNAQGRFTSREGMRERSDDQFDHDAELLAACMDQARHEFHSHPDRQAIDDWALYGPKNPRIAELVRQLALRHHLGVADIESRIESGLREWLQILDAAQIATLGGSVDR